MLSASFPNVSTIDIRYEWFIDIDIEYNEQQHAEKKAASISQLATLYRLNVLQVHLVRVFLEQVLPHAKKNLASRHLPDRVIWLHMHVFHRILEQRS